MLSQGRRHEILFTAITYVLFKESCVNLSDKEVINSTVDYPTNLSMSSYMDIILINQLFLLIKQIYMLMYKSSQMDVDVIYQSLSDKLTGKGKK